MAKYVMSNKVGERRDLQAISINSFLGLDKLNTNNNMPNFHATDMINYLVKDGALQTRSGWEQLIDLTNTKDTSNNAVTGNINNLFSFTYKGTRYYIAHIGQNIYFVNNFNTDDIKKLTFTKIDTGITIKDRKSLFIFADDRIYMLIGTYAVLKLTTEEKEGYTQYSGLYYKMGEVYDDIDTYIPTTTIGISYDNSGIASRNTYDDVNMLSSKRINTLNTYNTSLENAIKKFTLDSRIKTFQITGAPYVSIGTNYSDSNIKLTIQAYNTESNKINEIEAFGVTVYAQSDSTTGTPYTAIHYLWKNGETVPSIGTHKDDYYNNANCLGTIIMEESASVIHFKNAYNPPAEGVDNVRVEFVDDRENESNRIGNCTIGVLYGAGGNRNRLFLSGNSDIPQVDFHSSERNRYANDNDVDLTTYQDYTYFSVNDYCNYGTSNSAVMGYQIMGDGSLMVLKEESNNEPTIYFRKGTYESLNIEQGTQTITINVDRYPMYIGNVGEGLYVKNAIYNLNNDIVFVSRNGIFGISSTIASSTLSSDYKYAYSRSRLINNVIRDKLKNVATCLYDNRLFMTLPNGETYVADGRYTYAPNDRIDNEYEYEWFKLGNINATSYYVLNNKLYFANNNGLFLLDIYKENWTDIEYKVLNFGTSTSVQVDGRTQFTISNEVKSYIEEHIDKIKVIINSGSDIYCDMIEPNPTIDIDNFTYYPSGDYQELFRNYYYSDRSQYYLELDNQDTQDTIYVPINLFKKDFEESYTIMTTTVLKNYINKGYVISYLLNKIDTTQMYNLEINGNKMYIKSNSGTYFNLINISSTSSFKLISLVLSVSSGVYSEWWSRKFNCNNSLFNKILRTISVANDTDIYSKTNFGIKTKDFKIDNPDFEKVYVAQVVGGTNGLQDTYINLFKADLTKGIFSTSFNKDFNIKFNYIQFCFYNDAGENSVISNMTALYTFGFKTRGFA